MAVTYRDAPSSKLWHSFYDFLPFAPQSDHSCFGGDSLHARLSKNPNQVGRNSGVKLKFFILTIVWAEHTQMSQLKAFLGTRRRALVVLNF